MDLPRWFNYFSVILFLLIVGFSITNAVFYGLEIDNDDPNPPISSSNATILMWINIVLAILSLFAMIYFVWRIYKNKGLATESNPSSAPAPADSKDDEIKDLRERLKKLEEDNKSAQNPAAPSPPPVQNQANLVAAVAQNLPGGGNN